MTERKLNTRPEAGPSKKMKTNDGDWRLKASGFMDIVKVMLEKKISTDIILKLGSGDKTDELECHSFVLCGYSNVFETMLSERWIDKDSISESSKKILTLVGDDPEYFSYFLKTMYSDWNEQDYTSYTNNPIAFTPAICVGVLELATKYLAHHIVRRMRHFILCILYERSVEKTVDLFVLLEQLPICDDDGGPGIQILSQVMECIFGDAANIFASSSLAKIRWAYLKGLVKSDYLQCPEDVVFSGCIRWATEQCRLKNLPPDKKNLRDVLGEILNYIRFHLMDNKTLTDKVIASDILDPEEVKELFVYKINKGCEYLKGHTLKFPVKNRINTDKFLFVRLKSEMVSEETNDFSAAHGFQMTISETLRLNGIHFYCGDVTVKYDCKLDLIYVVDKIPQRVSCPTVVNSPSANNRFLVSFKNKIILPKEIPVLFKFTITGGNTHFSKEDVPESTNEIVVWNNRSIVLTFKKPTSLPNGLKQAPLMTFSNP